MLLVVRVQSVFSGHLLFPVANLVSGKDVDETEAAIAKYQEDENNSRIMRTNLARKKQEKLLMKEQRKQARAAARQAAVAYNAEERQRLIAKELRRRRKLQNALGVCCILCFMLIARHSESSRAGV